MQLLRLFLAFTLQRNVHQQITQISNDLQHLLKGKNIRWVDPLLFHITLKFLGNVAPSRIKEIDQVIASGDLELPFCEASFGGFCILPTSDQPRVICVVVKPDEKMVRVHSSLNILLASLGFDKEHKPYSPHITLARVRDGVDDREKKAIGKNLMGIELLEFNQQNFESITLFRSDLQRTGPVYTAINKYPLNGNYAKIERT